MTFVMLKNMITSSKFISNEDKKFLLKDPKRSFDAQNISRTKHRSETGERIL
jgi:hypothetical protein